MQTPSVAILYCMRPRPHSLEILLFSLCANVLLLVVFFMLAVPGTALSAGQTFTYDGADLSQRKATPGWANGVGDVVYAGSQANPESSDNDITLNSPNNSSDGIKGALGGLSNTAAHVSNNIVRVESVFESSGALGIYGGWQAGTGNAVNNQVIVKGGTLVNNTMGAQIGAAGGKAEGNSVTVSGGSLSGVVIGARSSSNGDLTGNKVTISGGSVSQHVHGAESMNGANVTGNSITITGGTVGKTGSVQGVVAGYQRGMSGYVTSFNTTSVSGASTKVYANVYGGLSFGATDTLSNGVRIAEGATVSGLVYGGETRGVAETSLNSVFIESGAKVGGSVAGGVNTKGGKVDQNHVVVDGATVLGAVSGAVANLNGITTNNTVLLKGGAQVNSRVAGAYGENGSTLTGNQVVVENGNVAGNIYGGFNWTNGDVTGNSVIMKAGSAVDVVGGHSQTNGNTNQNYVVVEGGTVNGNVLAAFNKDTGSANNNWAKVNGTAHIKGSVFGGNSDSLGDTLGNLVQIDGGVVDESVFGAYNAKQGAANTNRVEVTAGTIKGAVFGAASNNNGSASTNTVVITGGSVEGKNLQGAVFGGHSEGDGAVSGNKVFIHGGSIGNGAGKGNVYGAWSASTGDSNNNQVTVTSGTLQGAVFGAYNKDIGHANNNTVIITGGSITGSTLHNGAVFGGYSQGTGNANGNTVNLSGGTLGNNVYGGVVNGGTNNDAINNTVMLSGSLNLAAAAIYGGNLQASVGGDAFTGNTFIVDRVISHVKGIHNFENYSFFIPGTLGNGQVMFTVTGATPTDMDNTHVVIAGVGPDGPTLKVGDRLVLISKAEGTPASFSGKGVHKGLFVVYDFTLDMNHDLAIILEALYPDPDKRPQGRVVGDGRLAAQALIHQGGDMAAGAGMQAALESVDEARWPGRPAVFGTMQGGHSRYSVGSRITLDSFGLLTGVAWHGQLGNGQLAAGPFFETGTGNYESTTSFANAASVAGSGDVRYYGGGFLARYDWTKGMLRHLYLEGSVRAGSAETDYTNRIEGMHVNYRSTSPYYGAHAGLGYQWHVAENSVLDISSKFLWTRQEADTVSVVGEQVHFDSIDSKRIRLGARYSHSITSAVTPYVGAAWEYELDGKEKIQVLGTTFGEPTLGGGTAIGEAGVRILARQGNLSIDAAVQGYSGVRDGVGGVLRLQYHF